MLRISSQDPIQGHSSVGCFISHGSRVSSLSKLNHDTRSSPQLPPPALVLRDDCGPPGAVGRWAPQLLPPGPQDLPRDYGPDGAAGGLSQSTPRQADDTTTRLRERADASVRRPGLGARLLAMSYEARVGYDLQFRQRFFLPDNQRATVLGWKVLNPLLLFLSNGIFSRLSVADLDCNKRDRGFGHIFSS